MLSEVTYDDVMELLGAVRDDRVRDRLKAEVKRVDMTQEHLGELMGRKQPWVSKKLSGHIPLTLHDLKRFADALEVPVSRLLEEENPATHAPRAA